MINGKEMSRKLATDQSVSSFAEEIRNMQAEKLYQEGIIPSPVISSLPKDMGIFEEFFMSRIESQQIRALKNTNFSTYAAIIALQSFGAGMLTVFRQREEGRMITEFTEAEIKGFKKLLTENDPYMMTCSILEADPGTDDKKFLDSIPMHPIKAAGDHLHEENYLKAFARVLFDTGITMASI